jgi:cytochrome P450
MSPPPPGPRGLPLLGSVFPFHARRRLWFLEHVVRTHGDLCGFRVLWTTFVVVNDPQHALSVLANRDQAYGISFAPELQALELVRPPAEGLIRGGKVTRGGDSSARAELEQLAFEVTARSVERWRAAGQLEVIDAGGTLAVELAVKGLYRLEVDQPEELFHAIRGALTDGRSERRDPKEQREERRSRFARLKERALEQGPQDEALTTRRDGFGPLMLATISPMSSVLAWALLLLAEQPARMERAASDGEWRRAFVREVLRYRPPAWALARVAERDHELGG